MTLYLFHTSGGFVFIIYLFLAIIVWRERIIKENTKTHTFSEERPGRPHDHMCARDERCERERIREKW
jgi:hypothetical protein